MAVAIALLAYVPDMIVTNVHLSSGMRVALCVAFSNGRSVPSSSDCADCKLAWVI